MCTFTAEARAIELHVDNNPALYHALHVIFAKLAQRLAHGTYDPNMAPRAFKALAIRAARDYCREFARAEDISRVFPNGAICAFCKDRARLFESNIAQNMASDMQVAEPILDAISGGAAAALAAARAAHPSSFGEWKA